MATENEQEPTRSVGCEAALLGENPLYKALLQCLPEDFVIDSAIAKTALPKINDLGPFERSDFEVADVMHMLGHLYEHRLVERNVEETFIREGYNKREIYYRSKQDANEQLGNFEQLNFPGFPDSCAA